MNEHDTTSPGPTSSGASFEPAGTQPVTAVPTITYPTLPDRYALADDLADDPADDPVGAAAATGSTAATAARTRRPIRVRTVVFGLVLLAISVISLVALLTDVRVDDGVVGLGLLIGAGVALVAGGIAAAAREAKGGPGAAR